ncbi:MAG: LemA family protein [Bacillales bacterium]|jgi:LemA protein|nr:LemA family protein [Bacillales bacterium]
MRPLEIGLIIGAVVVVLIIIWVITTINHFKMMKVKIEESLSSIDVSLNKRYDLLKKSMDVVKAYTTYEKNTLKEIVALREGNKSLDNLVEIDKKISSGIRAVNALAEHYPELKANTSYLALQHQISDVEENLQASRRIYNANVSAYNQAIVVFPNSILAGSKHTKISFFEVEANKRDDIEIDL